MVRSLPISSAFIKLKYIYYLEIVKKINSSLNAKAAGGFSNNEGQDEWKAGSRRKHKSHCWNKNGHNIVEKSWWNVWQGSRYLTIYLLTYELPSPSPSANEIPWNNKIWNITWMRAVPWFSWYSKIPLVQWFPTLCPQMFLNYNSQKSWSAQLAVKDSENFSPRTSGIQSWELLL